MNIHELLIATCVATLAIGCGDDDGGTSNNTDAGNIVVDAGPQPGTDSGPPNGEDANVPDMDAGSDAGQTVASECNPFEEGGCDEGEKCSVVIKRIDDENSVVFYGCVSASTTRPEGVTCAFSTEGTPDVEGDDAMADNCGQGLFCAATNAGRFCTRMCSSDEGVGCAPTQACTLANEEPAFGFCQESDNCDVVAQTGCPEGENCYVLSNTQGGLVSRCYPQSVPDGGTGAAGEPCEFLNTCAAGTGCFLEQLDGGASGENFLCTPFCAALGTSDVDAGVPADMDAGVPSGGCSQGTCEALEVADGGVITIPTVPGVCR